jgi:hypothetical protein
MMARPEPPPLPLRWALALWLTLGFVIAVRVVICPDRHTVFPILAGASCRWWADQPLYAKHEPLDYFRYPPPFAVCFTPLALFGDRIGGLLWSALGIIVYVVGLRRFVRDVIPDGWGAGREAAFLALGALGALPGLWNAQSNALAVGLLLLAASALVRRRGWAAGAALASAVLLKLTPLGPALLLCALYPRRLVGPFALALLAGLTLPFLTKPPLIVWEHYREWAAHLTQTGSERWPGFRDAWTVWLVIGQAAAGLPGLPALRAPLDSPAYRVLQLLTAAGALAWCLRRRGGDMRRATTLTLAMGAAWLMLFGPSIEHPTYVFLAPALNWALLRTDGPRGRWLLAPAFVLVTFVGWGAVERAWADAVPALLTALPVGSALFLVWLIGYTGRGAAAPTRRAGPGHLSPFPCGLDSGSLASPGSFSTL